MINSPVCFYKWDFFITFIEIEIMWFVGDLHGKIKEFTYEIERRDIKNNSIIQVGDFGLGFNSLGIDMQNLDILNQICIERDLTLYIIRGNHDDPTFWYQHDMSKLTNIIFVKDYSIIEIENKRIFFAGGGISIDRAYRARQRMPHFEGEEFALDERRLEMITQTEKRIDIVVTHNAPIFFNPQVNSHIVEEHAEYERMYLGTDLKKALVKERMDIERMHDILLEKFDVKYWIYGHFHKSVISIYKSIRPSKQEIETTHILLNIKEFYEHKDEDTSKVGKRTKKNNT